MAKSILVTGATGYIGGRLVPRLLGEGHRVRCLVPPGAGIDGRSWAGRVDVVEGDVLDPVAVDAAVSGMDAAYYLVQPNDPDGDPDGETNRQAAHVFGRAAEKEGLKRIIYLGNLPPLGVSPSPYVRQRIEVGVVLRKYAVPVTELRAGVVIGSGSLAFELIRYVTERVPVLVAPNWISAKVQPIAVRNVLQYLVQSLAVEAAAGKIIPIGGPEVLSYREMFRIYAEIRGLRRTIFTLPLPSVRLSAIWLGMVTPITGMTARRFIEGQSGDLVLLDDLSQRLFDIRLLRYAETVRLALRRFAEDQVDTMWTDALQGTGGPEAGPSFAAGEGVIVVRIVRETTAAPESLWEEVCSVGGDSGWPYANALWKIRGMIDLAMGGVGNRRVRRSLTRVRVGDTIDFWRVEAVEAPRALRLRAEMKVPGKAWLEYHIEPVQGGGSSISQTAVFEPRGLLGQLYWYAFYLPHKFIFPGMVRELIRRAEGR